MIINFSKIIMVQLEEEEDITILITKYLEEEAAQWQVEEEAAQWQVEEETITHQWGEEVCIQEAEEEIEAVQEEVAIKHSIISQEGEGFNSINSVTNNNNRITIINLIILHTPMLASNKITGKRNMKCSSHRSRRSRSISSSSSSSSSSRISSSSSSRISSSSIMLKDIDWIIEWFEWLNDWIIKMIDGID